MLRSKKTARDVVLSKFRDKSYVVCFIVCHRLTCIPTVTSTAEHRACASPALTPSRIPILNGLVYAPLKLGHHAIHGMNI